MQRRPFLALYASLGLIAVLFGIVAWTLFDARQAVRHQAEQAGANITLSLERDIERSIATLDASLQTAARAVDIPGFAALDPKIKAALLFDGTTASPWASGVFLADAAGQVIYDSLNLTPRRVNIADRDHFRAHRDDNGLGLVISEPIHIRIDGSLNITLSRRINHPDGSFAGVAVAGLPIRYFETLFDGIGIGKQGVLNLVSIDRRQLIARRPFVEDEIGHSMADSPAFPRISTEDGGVFDAVSSVDGTTRIYTFRKISGLKLVVAVGLSTHDIYAPWWRKAIVLGLVVLMLIAILAVLAWTLRRELVRRIRAEEAARAAEHAIRRSAEELARATAPIKALFQHTNDMMLVLRAEAPGEFVYESVNPTWESVVGKSAAEAVGRAPRDVLAPDMAELLRTFLLDCAHDGSAMQSIGFPAGSGRDWEVMFVPVQGADAAVGRVIVVGREVTERHRLEADLRQAQKMEVIGRLAAGVSHDFNNILQVIGGGIDNLRDETTLSAAGSTFLDMIDRAARRGAELTHHLLAYSRKQMLSPSVVDPCALLDDLATVLSRTLGTDITVSVSSHPPFGMVKIDRALLETALLNLALNAAHAMPGGGTLAFAVSGAEAAPFGELRPGRHVVFAVTDSGTGMPEAVLACIFDPFFTTKGPGGPGLGLAMVQGFSRQSGGDVRAMSTLGEGSRFEIWLPEFAAAATAKTAVDTTVTAGEPGRVLVVDDAPDVLITLTAFLRAAGLTAFQAAGGKQALLMLEAGHEFDVLVTDYQMPSMKGPELIRRARMIQPGLPAIVVSGYADVGDFLTALPDVVLLLKPFQRDQFLAEINRLIAARRDDPDMPAGDRTGTGDVLVDRS